MSDTQYVYGQHAVAVVLERSSDRIQAVWLQAGRDNQLSRRLLDFARRRRLPLQTVTRLELDRAWPGARHQGVVVSCHAIDQRTRSPAGRDSSSLLQRPPSDGDLLLVLDGVQDPRNLGAVLRCADATGVGAVIIPRSRGTLLTPTARKVASGAAESVPVLEVANLSRTLKTLSQLGYWIVGTGDGADRSLFESTCEGPLVLVLGSEDKGIRRLTREACDVVVHLPMLGVVNSLNISVAAGVCLYELRRRQWQHPRSGHPGAIAPPSD